MVAAACLLQSCQMLLQHAALGEGAAVNAAEHLVFLAAAPVGTGAGGQLDGFYGAGGHQMGSGAEVGEIALTAEGNVLALSGVLLDQLQLIGLVGFQLLCFLDRQGEPLDGQIRLGNSGDLRLQLFQILRRKGGGDIKIVIKAVLDGWADGKLCLREQVLHRLRQHMGRRVVEGTLALLVLKGEDLHGAVVIQQVAQVGNLAVYQSAAGIAVQPHAQLLGKVGDGLRGSQLPNGAVLQGDFQHK